MDSVRKALIDRLVASPRLISEREILVLCSGITERVAEALERGGYRTVTDVAREEDVDRLSIRTGLGAQRAREVKDAVARFVREDLERVRAAIRAVPSPEAAEQA